MPEFEIFDHTADVGLEAYGGDLREAFMNAAKGMFSILTPAKAIGRERSFEIHLEAETPKELLVDWLNRLIYLYDAEKVILGNFNIMTFENTRLSAVVSGETITGKHPILTYIKAATHYQAEAVIGNPCLVRVIFDL